MSSPHRSHEKVFKLPQTCTRGQNVGQKNSPIPEGLIGDPNEVTVRINGVNTKALLDTGSTVSTLSESFYKNHLSQSTSINPLSNFIDIECADGQQLPYLGYIESNLAIDGIAAVKGIDNSIFLVVPDSRYNTSVPILLGTNILTELMSMTSSSHGTRFLQSNITTPWNYYFDV